MKAENLLVLATLLACSTAVDAQTGAVPPPRSAAAVAEAQRNAENDLVRDGALAMPGAIVRGGGMLNGALQLPGSLQTLRAARQVDNLMSGIGHATDAALAAQNDGWNGLMREGAQIVIETGSAAPFDVLTSMAARRAVGSGLSAAMASGGAGIAFTAGTLVGGYLRDSPSFATGIGLAPGKTLGDFVDDGYFLLTPDAVKEWASGTPQVDTESRAWQLQQEQHFRMRRRQAVFDRIQAENAQQQHQREAARAAALPPAAAERATEPRIDNGNAFVQMLRDTMAAQSHGRPRATPSTPQACTIDPRTGCHPGHDEKAHPGGCKCGR